MIRGERKETKRREKEGKIGERSKPPEPPPAGLNPLRVEKAGTGVRLEYVKWKDS